MCVCRLYMSWTQAFFCPPSCICLILTGAWFGALSRVCLQAYLPISCSPFCPPGYVHLYAACYQPITETWTVSPPPRGRESEYEGALSRRVHALTLGQAWTSTQVQIVMFECP